LLLAILTPIAWSGSASPTKTPISYTRPRQSLSKTGSRKRKGVTISKRLQIVGQILACRRSGIVDQDTNDSFVALQGRYYFKGQTRVRTQLSHQITIAALNTPARKFLAKFALDNGSPVQGEERGASGLQQSHGSVLSVARYLKQNR
jgi:hypothetical protein